MSVKLKASQFMKLVHAQRGYTNAIEVLVDQVITRTSFGYAVLFGESDEEDPKSFAFVLQEKLDKLDDDSDVILSDSCIKVVSNGVEREIPHRSLDPMIELPGNPLGPVTVPASFVDGYKTCQSFCTNQAFTALGSVGVSDENFIATDRIVAIRYPHDGFYVYEAFRIAWFQFTSRCKANSGVKWPDADIWSTYGDDCTRLLLPKSIPFAPAESVWAFVTKADKLYARISQSGMILYAQIVDGSLPLLKKFSSKSYTLAWTLLKNECSQLLTVIKRADDRLLLTNNDGYLCITSDNVRYIPGLEEIAFKTNIPVAFHTTLTVDREQFRKLLMASRELRFYSSGDLLDVRAADFSAWLMLQNNDGAALVDCKYQDFPVRRPGIGPLLCDDAEAIASENVTKLSCF